MAQKRLKNGVKPFTVVLTASKDAKTAPKKDYTRSLGYRFESDYQSETE